MAPSAKSYPEVVAQRISIVFKVQVHHHMLLCMCIATWQLEAAKLQNTNQEMFLMLLSNTSNLSIISNSLEVFRMRNEDKFKQFKHLCRTDSYFWSHKFRNNDHFNITNFARQTGCQDFILKNLYYLILDSVNKFCCFRNDDVFPTILLQISLELKLLQL